MITRSRALRLEGVMEPLDRERPTRPRKKENKQEIACNTSQRVLTLRQTPYRLAREQRLKHEGLRTPCEANPNPNPSISQTRRPRRCSSPMSATETPRKIKILLLIILAVFAYVVYTKARFNSPDDDRIESEPSKRFDEFSHDLAKLEKSNMLRESEYFWRILRRNGWLALNESSKYLPMGLLIVIPHREEELGYYLATEVVNAFNKPQNEKSDVKRQSNIPLFDRQTKTTISVKDLSMAIHEARDDHTDAVLIDHMEKLPGDTVRILDSFINPRGHNEENKLLVFTLYLPEEYCNSEFVSDYLKYTWLIDVAHRPTLVWDLLHSTIFVQSEDSLNANDVTR